MIPFIAVATARDLHEAQLACTMHAHENLHGEHPPQEPRRKTRSGAALPSFLRHFPRYAAPAPRRRARAVRRRSAHRSAQALSRDLAPPPPASRRSRPAHPRNASGGNAAAGFVPWRAEACEPIFRRQHHCPRPVAPRLTKRNLHTSVGSLREPFEGNRWTRRGRVESDNAGPRPRRGNHSLPMARREFRAPRPDA